MPIWKEKSFSFHNTERYNNNATIEMVANVSMYPTYPTYLGMILFRGEFYGSTTSRGNACPSPLAAVASSSIVQSHAST